MDESNIHFVGGRTAGTVASVTRVPQAPSPHLPADVAQVSGSVHVKGLARASWEGDSTVAVARVRCPGTSFSAEREILFLREEKKIQHVVTRLHYAPVSACGIYERVSLFHKES